MQDAVTAHAPHWAYVEWVLDADSVTYTVKAEHRRKRCAAAHPDWEVKLDPYEVVPLLGEELRHAVTADSEERVMSAARTWAASYIPVGANHRIVYIGAVPGR